MKILRRRKPPVEPTEVDRMFDDALADLDNATGKLRAYIALRRSQPLAEEVTRGRPDPPPPPPRR